jgi:hypothetical protein
MRCLFTFTVKNPYAAVNQVNNLTSNCPINMWYNVNNLNNTANKISYLTPIQQFFNYIMASAG